MHRSTRVESKKTLYECQVSMIHYHYTVACNKTHRLRLLFTKSSFMITLFVTAHLVELIAMKWCAMIGLNLYDNEIMIFDWVLMVIIIKAVQSMPLMTILKVLKAISYVL